MGVPPSLMVGRVTVQGLPTDNHAQITRHFLLMCSVGFDAHAVASVNSDLKGVVGTTAYVVSGITTLASYTPCNFTITADDFAPETYHAFSIVVSNAALYGGDFQIAPDALMDDGMFDVSIFTAPNELVPIQNISLLRQNDRRHVWTHRRRPRHPLLPLPPLDNRGRYPNRRASRWRQPRHHAPALRNSAKSPCSPPAVIEE